MKKYMILPEYRENWGDGDVHNDELWSVTDEEISRLALAWDKEKAELMKEVVEV